MTKRRIGVFGGTFSPPHKGHVRSAMLFMQAKELDYLYIIPSYVSPGKQESEVSPFRRFEMCCLAFSGLENVYVLDTEIKRGGPSYTVDTLSELWMGGVELYFLCGTDTALSLDKWKEPSYLFQLANFVCIPRDDSEIEALLAEKNQFYANHYGKEVELLPASPYPISSTEIRALIQEGKKEEYEKHLPRGVVYYIERNGLYK